MSGDSLPALPPRQALLLSEERAAEFESQMRERLLDIDDVRVLAQGLPGVEALAQALARTKPGKYLRASARRLEWRIGQVAGGPVGSGSGGPGRESIAIDSLLKAEELRQFRLISTLPLDWEDFKVWDQSRGRLLRLANERRRKARNDGETRIGDFREVLADLEPASVALILTDPPYADANADLYADLARFAAEKLVDGGSLICYVGHTILPIVFPLMSEHLRYWWLMALEHRAGGKHLPGKWVWVGWKPVLWFVKGARRDDVYVRDVIRGVAPDKELHEWAQGVDEVIPLIEALSRPGELVCDPFAGSGSFGVAALKTGRRYIGATLGS